MVVPAGSPSRGGHVVVYVKKLNQPNLPTPFYSVLVSISVFMALSTVFHSINSSDNSPLPHSVLPVVIDLNTFYFGRKKCNTHDNSRTVLLSVNESTYTKTLKTYKTRSTERPFQLYFIP